MTVVLPTILQPESEFEKRKRIYETGKTSKSSITSFFQFIGNFIYASIITIPKAIFNTVLVIWSYLTANWKFTIFLAIAILFSIAIFIFTDIFVLIFTSIFSVIRLVLNLFVDIKNNTFLIHEFLAEHLNLAIEVVKEFFRSLYFELCPNGFELTCIPGVTSFVKFLEVYLLVIEQYINLWSVTWRAIAIAIQDFICQGTILLEGAGENYDCLTGSSLRRMSEIIDKIIEDPTYFYINKNEAVLEFVQAAAGIVADVIDVIFNVIIEYVILIWLFLITLYLITVQHILLLIVSFTYVVVNFVFSLFFLTKGRRDPDDAALLWQNGTREEWPDFNDLALSRIVELFVTEIDPISLLLPNNETGYEPPGDDEVREVLVELAQEYDDILDWVFINLPYVLIWVDTTICMILHMGECAIDYELCELLFHEDEGLISPLFDIIDVLDFTGLLAAAGLTDEQQICEDIFNAISGSRFCICTSCRMDQEEILEEITPIFSLTLSNGVTCLPNIEDRCCLIASGTYKVYDQWCRQDIGSDYTSIIFFFNPGYYELLANDPPPQARCAKWGAVIEMIDQLKTELEDSDDLDFKWWFNTLGIPDDIDPKNHLHNRTFPFIPNLDDDTVGYGSLGNPFDNTIPSGPLSGYTDFCNKFFTIPSWYDPDMFFPRLYANVYTFDGCKFFMHSISRCYGFWNGRRFYKQSEYSDLAPQKDWFLNGGLICPDGAKILNMVHKPKTTYRKEFMCNTMETWINEIRNGYLRGVIINALLNHVGPTNHYVDQCTSGCGINLDDIPEWFSMDPRTILDFLREGKGDELCELYRPGGDGGESLATCKSVWSLINETLGDIVFYTLDNTSNALLLPSDFPNTICSFSSITLSTNDMRFIFPGDQLPSFGTLFGPAWTGLPIPQPNQSPYFNIWRYYSEGIGSSLSWSSSYGTYPFCLKLTEHLLGSGGIPEEFGGDTDAAREYVQLVIGDPEDRPIDAAVVKYLQNIDVDLYAWQPESSWGCEPLSATENSAMFNYDHLLTRHYMVVEYFMYDFELTGNMLILLFADMFLDRAFYGGTWFSERNQGHIGPDYIHYQFAPVDDVLEVVPPWGPNCSYVGEVGFEFIWDCNQTNFYLPYVFHHISHDYMAKMKSFFLKIFWNELKNEHTGTGFTPGEFTFLSNRIDQLGHAFPFGPFYTNYYIGSETSIFDYLLATSNILQTLYTYFSTPGQWDNDLSAYWSSIQNPTVTNNIATWCTTYSLPVNLCNAYHEALTTSTTMRKCLLNPFDNGPKDCIKLFFQENYNFREGLKIIDRIDTFNFPGEV
jgi:hypothetical protein